MTDSEDKSKTNMTIDDSNFFWQKIENEVRVKLPIYFKNICKLNNLDNPVAFVCIDDSTIDHLELFARESMGVMLNVDDDYRDYYGNFSKAPEKFRFVIGDRHLIKKSVESVVKKDQKFWEESSVLTSVPDYRGRKVNSPDKLAKDSSQNSSDTNINSECKLVKRIFKDILVSLDNKPKKLNEPKDKNDQGNADPEKENENNEFEHDNMTNKNSSVSVEGMNIQVSRKEIYDVNGQSRSHTYQVTYNCYYCKKKFSSSKIFDKNTKNYRWILTNYSKHIQSQHQLTTAEKRGKKRKISVSVIDLLLSSKKSQNKIDPASKSATNNSDDDLQEIPHGINDNTGSKSSQEHDKITVDVQVHQPDNYQSPKNTSNILEPIISGIY